MRVYRWLLLPLLINCGSEDPTIAVATADVASAPTIRVATFNAQVLGSTRSDQFGAVEAMVRRVDADVMCLQEVEEGEYWRLRSLARRTAYPHVFMGGVSSRMAGGLANACLSRFPILEAWSFTSRELSSDDRAWELGRDQVMVRVELPSGASMVVMNLHLKSGFRDSDRFRRQVEVMRAMQAIELHPADVAVVLGDFNELTAGNDLGQTFDWFPDGLPRSYRLGRDIRFPVIYRPFETIRAAGFRRSYPTQEDTRWEDGTRIPSGRRIDFVLYRGALLDGDEVYEACADNGIDDGWRGDRRTKAGEPLPCGTNEVGSDHRPVFVDLRE